MTAPQPVVARRSAPASAAPRRAAPGLAVVALVAVVVLLAASLLLGSQPIAPERAVQGLFGNGTSIDQTLMRDVRLPRTILCAVVGIGLGVAGCLTQAHTRNPMADPGLLGVTAGAAVGVVLAIALLGAASPRQYVFGGLVGGLAAACLVMLTARVVRATSPIVSLVLVGAALSAFLGAVTTTTVLLNEESLNAFRFWGTGVLSGQGWPVVVVAVPALLIGLALAVLNVPSLGAIALGDATAVALGRNLLADRLLGLAAVAVLTSAATVAAGSIAFVGLLAPHAAARIAPTAPGAAMGLSAVIGALLVLAADVAGRLVLSTSEVAVGIILGIMGAPLFIAIARAKRVA